MSICLKPLYSKGLLLLLRKYSHAIGAVNSLRSMNTNEYLYAWHFFNILGRFNFHNHREVGGLRISQCSRPLWILLYFQALRYFDIIGADKI